MKHRSWTFTHALLVTLATVLSAPLFSASVWVQNNELPHPRALHGVAVVNEVMYALGGESECFGFGCSSANVSQYNEASDSWTDVATLFPRKNHATVVVGGLIYLIGGDNNNFVFNSIEAFNPMTNTSTEITQMPHAGSLVGAVELGGQLYVLGGSADRGLIAEAYDLVGDTWRLLPNLPRLNYGMSAAAYQGQVWVIGGTNPNTGEVYAQVDAYDPFTGEWSAMPALPAPRTSAAAVVVDDTLYVIGGFTPGVGGLSSVLIYDPVTSSWVEGPALNVARTSPAAALLNGTVFAVGGKALSAGGTSLGNLATVESLAVGVTNLAPTANAGLDQTLHAGTAVSLDGSGSFDDNTPTNALAYAWSFVSQPEGSTATLSGANTQTPSFVPDISGTYVVELIVTDDGGLSSASDTVVISSTNQAPTANAGSDQIVLVGHVASLSGSGFDPEDDALTFAWTLISAPAGSTATLASANTATPTFVPDVAGTYSAQLVVNDGLTDSAPQVVHITAIRASDFSQLQIQAAANVIANLPLSSVTNPGNRNALANFLRQAVRFIQLDNLPQARQKLEAAIERIDGCALRGEPDAIGVSRDWITTCDAQGLVYQSLVDALAAISQ
jgi:N-acetylneuraminic acid mutarotase